MYAFLLQSGQNDLFSLILSMLIIAIPFLYITRMSAAARNRQQRPPRAPGADPDADLRLLNEEDDELEGQPAAYEARPAERETSSDDDTRRGTRRDRLRRSLSRPHPYEDVESERKTPAQLFREALQHARGEAPEEAEARRAKKRAAKRGRTAPLYESSARDDSSRGEAERRSTTYTSKLSPDLEQKRLSPTGLDQEPKSSGASQERSTTDPYARRRLKGRARISRLPRLQQAVLWSEILGPPKGLPEDDRDRTGESRREQR